MQKWDYQTLEVEIDVAKVDQILKKAGDTGWEIVSVTPIIATNDKGYPATKNFVIVMKRPKAS